MRKIGFLLLCICCFGTLSADINVKSFRRLDNDLDARVNYPLKDRDGQFCAIIKVVTTQTGFNFDGGQLGIVKTVQKPSEIWVYVPYGLKRLSIFHPQLGQLRDYMIPLSIEKETVYELVLITGKVTTIVEETIESQWLVITPEPADAAIYMDDIYIKTGVHQAKMKPGNYTYRVEAPLYHTEVGMVEISNAKKELNIKLKPNFGYVTVNSTPESGAQVFIDNKPLSKLTPMTTDALKSGEYTVKVMKEMYQPFAQKVLVNDAQTSTINGVLQPNFAELTLNAPLNAPLYINNDNKGNGTWQGRLPAGVFTVEARLAQHRDAKQDIELKIGEVRTVNLQPTPIYGSLDVITDPPGAKISIDGKDYGTTPNTISRLLIGDYSVQLSRQGYAPVSKTISITEGKSAMINETLINGREVTINSTPSGVNLFIDGNAVGKTPYTGNLTFGSHVLKIEREGKTAERRVEIAQSGGETNFTLAFGLASFTETVKGVSFEMIAIKGGTFQMGSNDGESDEKPLHQVTVSDFMMGKTEVTQALWQAVMGTSASLSNPSNFKGNNLPVEQVSWNDCQEFIKKLNQLTGKQYRLPTEAEWEYAAGGGATNRTKWAGTNSESNLGEYAWYSSNSGSKTQPVGTKKPNALGLYDMSGNVWEWCSDWYGSDYYRSSPQTNPQGPSSGSYRVGRSGSWFNDANYCRSAFRGSYGPGGRKDDLGFRLVLVP
ncbi:MAG: SUMF1/EgtB/PvdO family nonheme iron enzyme [Paludibacter sp.]|nr:SUMF1/EgtB/PvdO family nonheme iron enzyme [Paludibacter sp.]